MASSDASSNLRTELAATAARLIAEEGCEYAQAKRRAAHEVLGDSERRATMPDNQQVEHELRRYLKLFGGESHRAWLNTMRRTAADVMQTLHEFDPHLIGAVLNGTATEHSDIHLHLFVDDAKEVELRLMNLGIDFDVDDGDGERPAALECLNFVVSPAFEGVDATLRRTRIGVRLHVHARDAIRVTARHRRGVSDDGLHPIEATGRANLDALRKLMNETA